MPTTTPRITLPPSCYAIGDTCYFAEAPIAATFRIRGGGPWLVDEEGYSAIAIYTGAISIAPIPFTPNLRDCHWPEIGRMIDERTGRAFLFGGPVELAVDGSALRLDEFGFMEPSGKGFERLYPA